MCATHREQTTGSQPGGKTSLSAATCLGEHRTRNPTPNGAIGRRFVFFALGLMSKPMLVTWPFVMLLLDWWPLQRLRIQDSGYKVRSLVWEKIPFFGSRGGDECHNLCSTERNRFFGGGWSPVPGSALRQCADFVLSLFGQVVLAGESVDILSVSDCIGRRGKCCWRAGCFWA